MRRLVVGALAAALLLFGQAKSRYPSPVDVKLSPDGKRLYVLCQGTEELLAVNTATNTVAGRVPVGLVPRGLALNAKGSRAYVTNSWADTVTEVDTVSMRALRTMQAGFEPSGVALDGPEAFLYVGNRISNDISVIDLKTGEDVRRLAAGRGASYVTPSPDGGRVYVTHVYPNLGKFQTPPESEITEIDTEHRVVEARERLHNVAGVFQMAFSSDGKVGIAAQMRPKNLIPLAHVAHASAFGNSIVVFGERIGGAVQLPLDNLESHFSLPFGVAISQDGSRAYVSASGSDEVAILDFKKLVAAATSPNRAQLSNDLSVAANYVLARIPAGRNPRGLALTADGKTLYVANRLDDNVSVVDTTAMKVRTSIALGAPAAITPQRHGEQLFYTSKFAFHKGFGCAVCHIDSTFDGLSWDLEPDGFGVDIVDNRALEDVSKTAPYKWNGGNPDLETECGPRTEKFFYRSQSFDSKELADLVWYIKSIPLRPNRYRLANGEMSPAQERGKAIFDRKRRKDGGEIPDELQCGLCHSGKYHTNLQVTDVGSGKATDRAPEIDVPQLTNVALTAPYLHDGSAHTLEEIWTVFNPKDTHGVTNDLSKDELNDLIEYLKTL
jgi:YVTN family beta-propeller protein